MTSSLTQSQVISFVISIVICLFFILAGYPPVTDFISGWAPFWVVDIISNFSFLTHFDAFKRGVLDLRDFIYYISVIFLMLYINSVIISNRKS
jgi:ABC-2 type transport system permease protein